MKLSVISSDAGVLHIQCAGEVTQEAVQDANPLVDLLGQGCFSSQVMLNFEQATFLDSAGVGWLVNSHKQFTGMGGKMVLHSVPPMINHVLQLLRMPTVLHIVADEVEARKLLRGE